MLVEHDGLQGEGNVDVQFGSDAVSLVVLQPGGGGKGPLLTVSKHIFSSTFALFSFLRIAAASCIAFKSQSQP